MKRVSFHHDQEEDPKKDNLLSPSVEYSELESASELENGLMSTTKRSSLRSHPMKLESSHSLRYIKKHNCTDVDGLILKANAPPDYTNGEGNFDEILKRIRARNYYKEQFQRIQNQTEMSPFSLRFSEQYEPGFREYTQERAVNRVRMTILIGLISLTGFFIYETTSGEYEKNPQILNILAFGIAVPLMAISLALSYVKQLRKHLEILIFFSFLIMAIVLIVKKPVQELKGPIIPLIILLIPVFGITKLRFSYACLLGSIIFVTYLVVNLIWSVDPNGGVIYQSINYAISVVGGMVSCYRQELLRRRNYALQLPFVGGLDEDDVAAELKTQRFSKKNLMYTYSCKFRNPEVENTFYRFWYLIDPFPYEDANATCLHEGVFRVLRFAVFGLCLNQMVLGVQDYKFLDGTTQTIAFSLRYAIVIPAYLSAGVFMYFVGRSYYQQWLAEAEEMEKNIIMRHSERQSEGVMLEMDGEITNEDKKEFHFQFMGINLMSSKSKGGYVRSAQLFSALVIFIHMACMGGLLLTVRSNLGEPKPVYYMGFLNAILFAHRSGFRVRFVYATHCSMLVSVIFIICAYVITPDSAMEFSCYTVVVLALGMLISHEEESLRRSFFVLRSIRTLEFQEWFTVVLRVQGWVKRKLQKKINAIRDKKRNGNNEGGEGGHHAPIITNTSGTMAQASKYGVYTQMGNIAIALGEAIS